MQNILNEEGFQRMEVEISRYNDISTIMKKLKENGFFKAIYDLIFAVFASEHEFTLNMLQQMVSTRPQNSFKFSELYKINSSIFCNNFQLINKIIIDDIFFHFSQRAIPDIEADYSRLTSTNQAHFSEPQQTNQLNKRQEQSPRQQQQNYLPPNHGNGIQAMDLKKLNQNLTYISSQHPQIDSIPKKLSPRSNSAHTAGKPPTPHSNDGENVNISRQIRTPSSHSHQNPNIKQFLPDVINDSIERPNSQAKFYQQSLAQNSKKYSHSPPVQYEAIQSVMKYKSSAHKSASSKSLHSSYHFNSNNNSATTINGGNASSPPSMNGGQKQLKKQIEINQFQEAEPSKNLKVYLPYSEFSYSKGGSFTKSQRKIHDIADNPGVGEYESQPIQSVFAGSFAKQEKKTIFNQKVDYNPEMYYPSHHFVSKPKKN